MNGRYVDPGEMTTALPRVDPPTAEAVRRARLAVAHHSRSGGECSDLLDMLGIGPDVEVVE